ncbi:hypothetical protein V8B55DRAFT_1365718 [Mucor lusitanicus]|uniref:Uncharacterized protein n=2 Tax=Mucor circinelloides f. lusitanicus TaxID=29924 RepID=A0A168IEA0_MUCCL|nr:hypothetical protein FB192DRAFT_1437025 [Mucor lusitanicus]OAC99870.1 hypothetical protein MUCCIDRAFT_83750 [Mucor lusitanicus CBS 277.49]
MQNGLPKLESHGRSSYAEKALDLGRVDETKFYNYIVKKPELARHIRDVAVPFSDYGLGSKRDPNESDKLWSIILTEGLRSITGPIESSDAIESVCTILEESSLEFSGLTKVEGDFPDACGYTDLVELLSNNLKQTALSEDSIHLLGECKNLETLDLFLDFEGTLRAWEDMLQHCPNLTTLTIHFNIDPERRQPLESFTKKEFQTWARDHNVKQVESVKSLTLMNRSYQDCTPTICEYLWYKFPKLENVKFEFDCHVDTNNELFTQLITTIKSVGKHQIIYRIALAGSLDFNVNVNKVAEGSDNKMEIVWSAATGKKLSARVYNQQNSTSINIFLPLYAESQAFSILDIKHAAEFSTLRLDFRKQRQLGIGADFLEIMVQALAIIRDPNFMKNKPRSTEACQDSNDITQKLAQAMTAFQHLKTMEIWVYQLTLEMVKQLPVHRELTSLKIVGAYIDPNAFTTFSVCFPALEYLTLSSCLFANDSNSIWINLQQKSLITLALMDDRKREKLEGLNDQGKLYTPTLFHLELASQKTHLYLLLIPLHSMPLKIYKEQYEIWSKEPYTVIDITCGSVDTIIIRLGHISHALDVNKYI